MDDKPVVLIVGVEFHGPPEREQEFNKWYNEVHIPYFLGSRNVQGAVRYELVRGITTYPCAPKYLAIYQFENRQALEAVYADGHMAGGLAQRRGIWSGEEWEAKWGGAFEATGVWPAMTDGHPNPTRRK